MDSEKVGRAYLLGFEACHALKSTGNRKPKSEKKPPASKPTKPAANGKGKGKSATA